MQDLLLIKVKLFGDYLISRCNNEDKKHEIEKSISNLNFMEVMFFITFFNKNKIDCEINNFINKFDIDNSEETKNGIKEHLDYFIQV